MNSSKLSTPRSFLMPIMWCIFAGWLLSFSLTFILFQKHVEWFFPAFINCLHLYANWWFSWRMFSEIRILPENFLNKVFRIIVEIFPVGKDFSFPVSVIYDIRHCWKHFFYLDDSLTQKIAGFWNSWLKG